MLAWLSVIAGTVAQFGTLCLWALETGSNALIAGLAAAATAAIALLPALPDPPDVSGTWIGWLNWFFPLGPAVAAATTLLALYVGFLVLRVALRWAKAL